MDDRFRRSLGAMSEQELEILSRKKAFIAGCGGIGGYLAEYLLRIGVGEIAVADFDRFEVSNLNRQLLCTEKNLGSLKSGAAAVRAAEISSDTCFSGHVCRLDERNLPGLLTGFDIVLDALDNVKDRRLLKAECDRQGIPYVFGAVSGWVAQAALSRPNDGLFDLLFPADYTEEDNGILSFTPALCAAMQAALSVTLLCGRPVEQDRLYSFDLQSMNYDTLNL